MGSISISDVSRYLLHTATDRQTHETDTSGKENEEEPTTICHTQRAQPKQTDGQQNITTHIPDGDVQQNGLAVAAVVPTEIPFALIALQYTPARQTDRQTHSKRYERIPNVRHCHRRKHATEHDVAWYIYMCVCLHTRRVSVRPEPCGPHWLASLSSRPAAAALAPKAKATRQP